MRSASGGHAKGNGEAAIAAEAAGEATNPGTTVSNLRLRDTSVLLTVAPSSDGGIEPRTPGRAGLRLVQGQQERDAPPNGLGLVLAHHPCPL